MDRRYRNRGTAVRDPGMAVAVITGIVGRSDSRFGNFPFLDSGGRLDCRPGNHPKGSFPQARQLISSMASSPRP